MTIGVYGLGRFGSFFARMLATRFPVHAASRSTHEAPAGVTLTDLPGLGSCDAVFLCPAISAIPDACRLLAPHLRPGQTVLDTCSVKVWPLERMASLLPRSVSLVGTHPMFGPDSARNGWQGLPMVITPVEGRSPEGAGSPEWWASEFASMGLHVLSMSPDAHDAEAARTQGLVHLLGRVLAEMGPVPSEMGTLGYRKLLEVMEQTCNDPWRLFLDLQGRNPHTIPVRDGLRSALDRVLQRLGEEAPQGEE